jgi:hypothetical protein
MKKLKQKDSKTTSIQNHLIYLHSQICSMMNNYMEFLLYKDLILAQNQQLPHCSMLIINIIMFIPWIKRTHMHDKNIKTFPKKIRPHMKYITEHTHIIPFKHLQFFHLNHSSHLAFNDRPPFVNLKIKHYKMVLTHEETNVQHNKNTLISEVKLSIKH